MNGQVGDSDSSHSDEGDSFDAPGPNIWAKDMPGGVAQDLLVALPQCFVHKAC